MKIMLPQTILLKQLRYCVVAGLMLAAKPVVAAGEKATNAVSVVVNWDKVVSGAGTELTIQVCPEPPMLRGGPIHQQTHDALRDLKVSTARLQPWFPYPRLSMAALEPPANGQTSWDFSLIDPIVLDFYAAAEGRPVMLNFAIPGWMFKGTPPSYPEDPHEIDWFYEFGPNVSKELRDPTFQEPADYFRRMAEWYIRGGFLDEYGKKHHSGHRLKIDYWEVLNEQDDHGAAHELNPQTYTALYDKVVAEVRKVDPAMKFSGLALAQADSLHYFEYFLNSKNHEPGTPLDMVSYHKYVVIGGRGTQADWQRDSFDDADRFLGTVRKIESIRRRLSPDTKTFISEFGFMWMPETYNTLAPLQGKKSNFDDPEIPEEYWHLASSVFAYVYLGATRAGVDLMAAAELVDYPGQFAGTNLIHWKTGEPNAVYRTVKLIHDQLPAGVKLLQTETMIEGIDAQAFAAADGRRLLLINKTDQPQQLHLGPVEAAITLTIDAASGFGEPRRATLGKGNLQLDARAVTLVIWDNENR